MEVVGKEAQAGLLERVEARLDARVEDLLSQCRRRAGRKDFGGARMSLASAKEVSQRLTGARKQRRLKEIASLRDSISVMEKEEQRRLEIARLEKHLDQFSSIPSKDLTAILLRPRWGLRAPGSPGCAASIPAVGIWTDWSA